MSDWETDIYKRRGEVESYQPRLSQNYAQADLVAKRLEDDNRASLSFMKSKVRARNATQPVKNVFT